MVMNVGIGLSSFLYGCCCSVPRLGPGRKLGGLLRRGRLLSGGALVLKLLGDAEPGGEPRQVDAGVLGAAAAAGPRLRVVVKGQARVVVRAVGDHRGGVPL